MSADEIDGKSLNLPELEQDGWSWAGSVWKRPRWLKAALAAGQSFSSTLRGLSLLPIHENPDIGDYAPRGAVIFAIGALDAHRVSRQIHFHAPNKPAKEIKEPPQAPGSMKTRWDMNLKPLFDSSGGKQRVLVRFELHHPDLRFLWLSDFPLTVKTPEGQLLICNPRFDEDAERWISVQFLYEPGNPDYEQVAEFNLALIVDDREDPSYCLPLIIDPRWGNVGAA